MCKSIKNLQIAISEEKIDALLICSPYNRLYSTAFSSTDGMVFITQNNAFLIVDTRYEQAAKRLHGIDVIVISNGKRYSDVISELCSSLHLHNIGFEDDFMTVNLYKKLIEAVDAEFIPASNIIEKVKSQKNSDEIENIIKAQRIAESAYNEILEIIKPDMTEKQIAAQLISRMYLNGAEGLSFEPIVVSGINSSMPHGIPSDKKIAHGEFVTMDFGCIYNGYCSDMTRTIAVGSADDEMRRVYNTVLAAQEKGISASANGTSCHFADLEARNVIEEAGYGEYFVHALGHGVGTEIHEAPVLGAKSQFVLLPGMVVTVEPGIYIPNKFGVRIEDMLVIHENSTENITLADKQLIVL